MLLRVASDKENDDAQDAGEIDQRSLHDRVRQVDAEPLDAPLLEPPGVEADEEDEEGDEEVVRLTLEHRAYPPRAGRKTREAKKPVHSSRSVVPQPLEMRVRVFAHAGVEEQLPRHVAP